MSLLSLPHITMIEAAPDRLLRAAAVAGFDAVSLRLFATMNETPYPLIESPPLLKRTLAVMAGTGVKVLDIEAIFIREATEPPNYLRGFEVAAELGAKIIQAAAFDAEETRLTDTYGEICRLASSFGLIVALEPMAFSPVNSVRQAARIVRKSRAENAGLVVDALHLQRCGEKFSELRAALAEMAVLFQLCDGNAAAPAGTEAMIYEARCDRKLPGGGQIDLLTLWEALPHALPVSVETPLGPSYGALSFDERSRLIKRSADRFFAQTRARP